MAVAVGCIARVPFLCACVRAYNASDGCKEDKQDLLLSGDGNRTVSSLCAAAFLARPG